MTSLCERRRKLDERERRLNERERRLDERERTLNEKDDTIRRKNETDELYRRYFHVSTYGVKPPQHYNDYWRRASWEINFAKEPYESDYR